MGRKKIVAANWKMNTNYEEALKLARQIKENSKIEDSVLKLIFPPFPFIKSIMDLFGDETGFAVGAQNCSQFAKGAYTGEVSCSMIQSLGASYVLIGHSERRQYFLESNKMLLEKINMGLENNLKIIFCFGEKLEDRKSNQHFEKVKIQLEEVVKHIPGNKMDKIVLAYEPVWAIGTGETATAAQAQEMHAFTRKILTGLFSEKTSSEMSILYGGSCNSKNAKELFSCPDVDGGLIGGASLISEEFCKITASF